MLGYAITSMETETYRPARLILLGDDATPELRRATSLDALVTSASPPFFVWHTAEDASSRRSTPTGLPRRSPPTAFPTPPMSSPTVRTASAWRRARGDAAAWTTLAAFWITEQSDTRPATPPIETETAWN